MKNACVVVALLLETISAVSQPTITQQPVSQVVVYGETATFNVAVTGTGPFLC